MITNQLEKDLQYTYSKLSKEEIEKLTGSSVLITGCAGFLGFYFVHFLYYFRETLKLKNVICLDNFIKTVLTFLPILFYCIIASFQIDKVQQHPFLFCHNLELVL